MAPPEAGNATGATASAAQPQNQGNGSRGRGQRRNQGRRGGQRRRQGENNVDVTSVLATPAAQEVAAAASRAHAMAAGATTKAAADGEDDDGDVCFICANPVAHYSITPCNHTTCHICGLRMRALYKTKDCPHCRTPAPFVIFSDEPERRFEDYTENDFTTTDSKIGIKYTNEDIVGDTVLLLRYNCPHPSCDFAGFSWSDLHNHVSSAHDKRMCGVCTRNKKVFTHEHELFSKRELEKHERHGDDKPGATDQTGFKGHPLCGFCNKRFYDDDELYEHCRYNHERCFICDRSDSTRPHYYVNYNSLEEHFKKDHYLCYDRECLEKKFVVFGSELDLQAHQLSEHGGKTTGRDARVVNISGFDLRTPYQQESGGSSSRRDGEGRRGGRDGRRGGHRGRDPNAETVPASSAQPMRRDELAFHRQMAIHSAQSVSNRTFGGSLSAASPTPAAASAPAPSQPRGGGSSSATPRGSQTNLTNPIESATIADTSNLSPEERARLVRHGAVVERASNLLGNDTQRMATFRSHISSYRQGELTAPQLIDAFFTLFADTSPNALGSLVSELADLYEEKSRADALRRAWQNWRAANDSNATNDEYPSLPSLGGMHGATSSSSGWVNAASANPGAPPSQKYSHRVLKLKNSTRLGGPAPVSTSGPSTWAARPAVNPPISSSSAAFPSLPSSAAAGSSSSSSASRANWTSSTPSSSQPSTTLNQPRPAPRPTGEDAFPALPAAPKPTTTIFGYGNGRAVRRDYGHRDTGFQWGGGGGMTGGGKVGWMDI
ncbi:hypothetical protein ACJZ2D_006592 [Fusarium nematophilum]